MSRYDIWKTAYPEHWDEEEGELTAEQIAELKGCEADHAMRDDRED